MPLMGLVIGAAAGALGAAITDVGVNDNFMKEFGQKLTPGTSAPYSSFEGALPTSCFRASSTSAVTSSNPR